MAAKDEAKIPPEELETKEGEDPNCNLIVNYLPPTVAEEIYGDCSKPMDLSPRSRLFETSTWVIA
jgi:hypothetical protein